MKPSRTFRHGGIRVEIGGDWEQKGPVRNAFLPNGAVILLKQHSGPQARCVVRKGEYVREGMVIGRAESPNSANVHASIPGVVRDIRTIALPEGGQSEAVVIALEGSFERLGRREERYLWKTMGRNEMLAALRDKGVVDAESPGIPLFDLFSERKEPGLLIINAVECEPYLKAESSLLKHRGEEVMEGISILRKLLSPKRTILAMSRPAENSQGGDPSAPPSWFVEEKDELEYLCLEPKYPQDMRAQLLAAILGHQAGEADAVLLRPSTVFAVFEAIVHGKPMVERYVSVGGGALKHPAVLKARIGTPIGDLIEECGGFLGPPARLVLRGALRGHSVHDLDVPITKTTQSVTALDAEEVGSLRRSPCIRCARCADACPERLDPDLLFRLVERGLRDRALELGLASCTACGACGHLCPSRLPLVAAFSTELRAIREAGGLKL
jgi:Na+-translocating ferredoxin:NAD+ oxidoreductase subunit C